MHHQWEFSIHAHSLFHTALSLYKPAKRLADIGCGIRPQNIFPADLTIYVEPYSEYADWLDAHGFHPLVRQTAETFLSKTSPLDCVVLFDVIEHMEKDEGKRALKFAREKAKQVFVFTPHGFQENEGNDKDGKDAWGLGGIEMQRHKSGWYREDFEGWSVFDDGESILAVWG